MFDGKIFARCSGRSEFGPRALGGRSMANSNMRCDSFKSHMIINKLSKFL
ncbi:carbamoyltransferase C-terminal domain-containing protein [Acinetobacter nosocomialis]|nr:carbamoyltransferase C-terminal domain-containing protein [Acinetobacter nosocomialis]